MKATLSALFALLLAALAGSSSYAQFCPSCSGTRLQYMPAPAYAPSYGTPYFPSYGDGVPPSYGYIPQGYGYMPPQPYGGFGPPSIPFGGSHCSHCGGGSGAGNILAFPTHQYARSPRDYWMLDLDCCGTH